MTSRALAKKRPATTYSPRVAERLCCRISEGETIREICARKDMPSKATLFRWLNHPDRGDFRELYSLALATRAYAFGEETVSIADNTSEDARSRAVRIQTRQWLAGKLDPKRFGSAANQHRDWIHPDEATRVFREMGQAVANTVQDWHELHGIDEAKAQELLNEIMTAWGKIKMSPGPPGAMKER